MLQSHHASQTTPQSCCSSSSFLTFWPSFSRHHHAPKFTFFILPLFPPPWSTAFITQCSPETIHLFSGLLPSQASHHRPQQSGAVDLSWSGGLQGTAPQQGPKSCGPQQLCFCPFLCCPVLPLLVVASCVSSQGRTNFLTRESPSL